MDNKINITLGNCLEVLKNITSDSVDLVICDPPYGCTQNHWDKKLDMNLLLANLIELSNQMQLLYFFLKVCILLI